MVTVNIYDRLSSYPYFESSRLREEIAVSLLTGRVYLLTIAQHGSRGLFLDRRRV